MAKFKSSALKGSIPALVTPFRKGKVDIDSFQKLVEWHIASGTHGLVPCGTTGETPTLHDAEHKRLIDACIEAADGRVPVIAGAGSNSTEKAIDLARHAEKSGADAILVVTPYYNKPTQEGMYQHFKAVNDACGLPIIAYNVPGRTGVEISVETVVRAANGLKRFAGIKDASVDLSRPLALRVALGDGFIQLSGEDATVAAYLAQGGHGCISVTAIFTITGRKRTGRILRACATCSCRCTKTYSSRRVPRPSNTACRASASAPRRCACRWSPSRRRRARSLTTPWSLRASSRPAARS
jgi:4-hydroxy-tetrahydrodipicolinate synthase